MTSKIKVDSVLISGENIIYFIIVVLLYASAALLIIDEVKTIFQFTNEVFNIKAIIEIIAKTLLLLMIIEILATVRISIKEHTLCAEPFLIVGLIASIRRILIISVETAYVHEYFSNFMIEIGVLVGLILVFVISIILLRKHNSKL